MENRKAIFLTGCIMAAVLTGCGSQKQEETSVEMLTQTAPLADYSAYVTLGQYAGFEIPVEEAEVSQEELEERMAQTVEAYNYLYAVPVQITDRAVQEGDTVNLNFTTTVDGENQEALAGQDVSYVVGAGAIHPALDGQLVGKQPGNTYDLSCAFKEDTEFTGLEGRTAIFHVTVNYIYGETQSAVWGDEVAAAMSGGAYTDADDYKEHLYEQMCAEEKETQEKSYRDGLWESILDGCTFQELPQDVLAENAENYYQKTREQFEYYATYYSYTYDQYMEEIQGMTDAQFHEKAYEYARAELERIYAAVEIFRAEGMTFTDEDYSRGVAELAGNYGYGSSAEFVEAYGEEYIREVLIVRQVEAFLMEQSKMAVQAG